MKIILAGGSGYIGRLLAKDFLARGYAVITLARSNFRAFNGEQVALWDGKTIGPWVNDLDGADVLINLAGRTVNCRYTKKNRAEMMQSRVESTRVLGQAIAKLQRKPKLWMNSSTATIYRHSLDREQTEDSGELGKGLSVEIAKAWEKEFFAFREPTIRMIALRSAMLFGPPPGGVYEAYRDIAGMGLGGRAGTGKQYVSWIHAEDFVGMINFLVEHEELDGIFNLAAPNPVPNSVFMRELRQSLGIKLGLPCPEWLLEIGAIFKKTETELLLKSRRVVPARLLAAGYRMRFDSISNAFTDLAR